MDEQERKVDGLREIAKDVRAKIAAGEMTVNEGREALGLEPLADFRANERYRAVNWAQWDKEHEAEMQRMKRANERLARASVALMVAGMVLGLAAATGLVWAVMQIQRLVW